MEEREEGEEEVDDSQNAEGGVGQRGMRLERKRERECMYVSELVW